MKMIKDDMSSKSLSLAASTNELEPELIDPLDFTWQQSSTADSPLMKQ